MNKPKAVIFDIDGTLANDKHRIHHINKSNVDDSDWQNYHSNCIYDDEYTIVCDCCRALYQCEYKIILITGRDKLYEPDTKYWLEKNNICFHELHMRENGNHESSVSLKSKIYEEHIQNKYDVIAVFEDRTRVVNMWREKYGLICLQTQEGNY